MKKKYIYCEFCEKLFEFLVNFEILNYLNKYGVNIYIPSQNKEKNTGIDSLFQKGKRKLLYLQYKIPKKYIDTPSIFKGDSFIFDLYFKNGKYTQHNHLVSYATKGLCAGYVVPLFIDYNSLYKAQSKHLLLNETLLITPFKRINDNSKHYIDYDRTNAYQHSNLETCQFCRLSEIDKAKIKEIDFEQFMYILNDEFMDSEKRITKENIDSFLAKEKICLFFFK